MPSNSSSGSSLLENWLESVENTTVKLTAPEKPDGLGAVGWKQYYVSPCKHEQTWCENCEDYHVLIKNTDEVVGHCPECGRIPGMLELGKRKTTE